MKLTNASILSVYRARKLLRDMLGARGYHSVRGPRFASAVEFKRYVNSCENPLELSLTAQDPRSGCKVVSLFFEDPKVGVKDARSLVKTLEVLEVEGKKPIHCIFFYRTSMSHFAKRLIDAMQIRRHETFCEESFLNPTLNALTPPHRELADGGERESVLRKAGGEENLPKILQTDAVCRWYGFAPGTVVEIERCLPEGQTARYYRLVSPA